MNDAAKNNNEEVAELVIDALNKALIGGATVTREIITKFVAMYSAELGWVIENAIVAEMVREKLVKISEHVLRLSGETTKQFEEARSAMESNFGLMETPDDDFVMGHLLDCYNEYCV